MPKKILVDAVHPDEARVVIDRNNRVEDFDYESPSRKQLKGNVYLAKVTRVEPSLQAAFIEYGTDKHGFLPFSEIHPDYYQIPVADRKKLFDEVYSDEPEDDANGNVDDLSDDDEVTLVKSRYRDIYKKYKIQEVLKRNQVILMQVIKEERGNKGASLTTYISLAGRYCVLMPNSPRQGGISRRISDPEDRKRLRSILKDLKLPKGTSVIVRTAGIQRKKDEIKRDYDYLVKLWNNIRNHTLSSTAPAFIHEESDLIKRTIRDWYNHETSEVLIEGEKAYKTAKEFMKMIAPDQVSKIKPYKGKMPIFSRFKVEEQLAALYDPVAPTRLGGSLVINPTEAMISIDVNSGKATTERDIEETAIKTNIEAAKEVARQLRLRDLSGLIVIDFIDMLESKNRRAVERAFKEALQGDRARIQVGRISNFGLLEMSRQRLRPSFLETNTVNCSHCDGTGVVRSPVATASVILRALKGEIGRSRARAFKIFANVEVMTYLMNQKRYSLVELETAHKVTVTICADPALDIAGFYIERERSGGDRGGHRGPLASEVDISFDEVPSDDAGEDGIDGDEPSKPSRRQKRRGGSRRGQRTEAKEVDASEGGANEGQDSKPKSSSGSRRRKRGPRGEGREQSKVLSSEAVMKSDNVDTIFKGIWKKIVQ